MFKIEDIFDDCQLDRISSADLCEKLIEPEDRPGATSIDRDDLRAAIELGIRKINVGSALKQAFFDALRHACLAQDDRYNPYEVIGSGLEADILVRGRLAMQEVVEDYLRLFGSAGKAGPQGR